jgi:hypothetical protein
MTAPSALRLHKILASAGQGFTARLTPRETRNQPARGSAADGRCPPDGRGPDASKIAVTKAAPAEGRC